MRREPGAGHALPPIARPARWPGVVRAEEESGCLPPVYALVRVRTLTRRRQTARGAGRLAHAAQRHPLGGRTQARRGVQPGCMWPFRRKPAPPEVDLGRRQLRRSQLEITKGYGWQASEPKGDQDVLRVSLERHEDDLLPVAEPPVD